MGLRPRVLFVSGREREYIRNRVLIQALQQHYDTSVFTPNGHSTLGRITQGLARFITSRPDYDVCLAGFYGQPIAIALSVLQRKPIVFDAYVSTFDTLCQDRHWFHPRSPVGWLARWLDRRSCQVATRVLTDTQAHARYFAASFGVAAEKLVPIGVGCDESLFYPRRRTISSEHPVEVFYYGAFLPLHGTKVIIQAAHLLRERSDIRFTIGGSGPRYKAIRQMIGELELTNVDLQGWIRLEDLPGYIARASVCLGGHFSEIPKAARVVSTKTFQFVAMRKPTIVGDNPATRELFAHREHVYAIRMGDPAALADAITTLADDVTLRKQIASGGYRVFQQRCTTLAIACELRSVIEDVLAHNRPTRGSQKRT